MAKSKNIWDAAFAGELTYVEKCVAADPKAINSASRDGYSPLHAAALGGQIAVVEFLIQCGANVNATDGFGCNVLQTAIMGAHAKPPQRLRLVTMLLNAGADSNHVSESAGCVLATVQNYRRSNQIRDLIIKCQLRKSSVASPLI